MKCPPTCEDRLQNLRMRGRAREESSSCFGQSCWCSSRWSRSPGRRVAAAPVRAAGAPAGGQGVQVGGHNFLKNTKVKVIMLLHGTV